jgi:transposase
MVASISEDLRQRVVSAYKAGGVTYAQVAKQFSVGNASVSRWLRLDREQGSLAPKAHGGGQKRLIEGDNEKLLRVLVLAHPDWTEAEYTREFNAKTGLSLKASTIGRAIRRLGFGVKKRLSSPPSAVAQMSSNGTLTTKSALPASPLRVWFLWTKPASTQP